MKIRLALSVIVFFTASGLSGQTADNCVIHMLLNTYSEKVYSSEPVTDPQLDLILASGIKAPSARNKQPWKFTVIKDETVMREVIKDAIPGNVLIVISGLKAENGTTPDFDCGLAAQNMFTAAHGLGLGARIYGGPAGRVNEKREHFHIPQGHKAVVILRIGNVDPSVDAVTAATPRNDMGEVVNYHER